MPLPQAYFGRVKFKQTKFSYWYSTLESPYFSKCHFRKAIFSYEPYRALPKWANPQFPLYSLRASGKFYEPLPDGSKGRLFLFRIMRGKQYVQQWRLNNDPTIGNRMKGINKFREGMKAWKEVKTYAYDFWKHKAQTMKRHQMLAHNAFMSYWMRDKLIKVNGRWEVKKYGQ